MPIPAPEFVVFYNGKEQMPERKIAKLSHMFTLKNRSVKLDLEVTILNITGENNRELKAACRTLREYAIYTDKIRQYTEEMSLEEAVDAPSGSASMRMFCGNSLKTTGWRREQ